MGIVSRSGLPSIPVLRMLQCAKMRARPAAGHFVAADAFSATSSGYVLLQHC
jgi:hypothetical protein